MQLMSEQIDQLATALAKAQGEMPTANKNCNNPFFKSMYADFESIKNACSPSLSKYGLSFVQVILEDESGSTCLITMLMHSSGQWIKSKAKISPAKNDIQSISSYNTYLKRMCLSSLVGIATGEADDDGEASMERSMPAPSARPAHQPAVPINQEKISEDQLEQLSTLSSTSQESIKNFNRVNHLKDLTKLQYVAIVRTFKLPPLD